MSSRTSIPLVASAYLTLYRGLPTVNFPFTNLDISFSLLGAAFLTSIRFGSEYILVSHFGWPKDAIPTLEAAAFCSCIAHSTILCAGLIVAFLTQTYDVAAKIKDQGSQDNKKWWPELADSLLQFCTGYMIYDTIINILWLRWNPELATFEFTDDDYLFLGHHFATSFYMTSARIIGAGYMSAMICMLLGEMTNPFQNSHFIADAAMTLDCCNGPSMQKFHFVTKIIFSAAYFFVRVFVGPPFFAKVTYELLFTKKGRANIPLVLNIFWNILIWAVVFGSSSWIQKCYHVLEDFVSGTTNAGSQQEL